VASISGFLRHFSDGDFNMMTIHDWPADERPREKLLQRGASALSDAELLAIFLRTGVRGKTAVDLGRELILKHRGLRPLLSLSATQCCNVKGIGQAKYAQLQAALELGRRYLRETLEERPSLTDTHSSKHYLCAQLRDLPHEVFACLYLDNRHKVIGFEPLFRGTIDGASVHPREVVKRCLEKNAAAVIVAHNHPSGCCEPSRADIQITRRLTESLSLVDIRLLDHIIVADGEPYSFAEKGVLPS
jgi:DNA repair protein RadC